jgi:hypothetical protein
LQLSELDEQIRVARKRALDGGGHTPSWFVLFKSQKAAAIASSTILHAEDNLQFQVCWALPPGQG